MDVTNLEDALNSDHDDFVEYFILHAPKNGCRCSSDEDEFLKNILGKMEQLSESYIWHKEPFNLNKMSANLRNQEGLSRTNISCYHGLTKFGDNMEDEWFIVFMLKELSKQLPCLVCRIFDNDGEFLLFEAAENLPKWAESDKYCEKRAYICEAKLHLIPHPKKQRVESNCFPESVPTLREAFEAVRNYPNKTVCSDCVQRSISNRTSCYPDKIESDFHRVNVFLPPPVCVTLKKHPKILSAAIDAFCSRVSDEMKIARTMPTFKPGKCIVRCRVTFTKCLYAMCCRSDFKPDRRSGWSFPLPASKDYRGHSLGAKITAGLEILLGRQRGCSSSKDYLHAKRWACYIQKLKKTGYFQDYLEGSEPYDKLMEVAKNKFTKDCNLKEAEGTNNCKALNDDYLDKIVNMVNANLNVDDEEIEKIRNESKTLPPDDDESWLNIDSEKLENLLQEKYDADNFANSELSSIPNRLRRFIHQVSDYEGVENVPDSDANHGLGRVISEGIDFRPDDFINALDKVLGTIDDPHNEWASDSDSLISDDDMNDNLEEIRKMHTFKKDSKFFDLMKQMDEELASTEVGKTFAPNNTDSELVKKLTTSATGPPTTASVEELDDFDKDVNEDNYPPVHVDINTLANILESYQSQESPSGPSATLLKSVGFGLNKSPSSK